MERFKQSMKEQDEQIKGLLNEEQQANYQAFKKDRFAKRGAFRKGGKHPWRKNAESAQPDQG